MEAIMKVSLKVTAISALSVLICISAMMASAEETFHHGDVNGDNVVDAVDASLILNNYAAASTSQSLLLDETQIELADTNGDGQVNALDSTMVLGYYGYVATNGTITPEEYYLNASAKDNGTSDIPQTTSSVKETTPVTTVKPQGMNVHTDKVVFEVPEPVYTESVVEPKTEPKTEPETEPETEPVTEPEVVHGEGCQYFHCDREYAWHCTEGNDGYPDWYDAEDKENFKYAFNEALNYTDEFGAVTWATRYVGILTGRDKSEVFIGDPTDGDGRPAVWVLQGYNEDGDEIWVTGK